MKRRSLKGAIRRFTSVAAKHRRDEASMTTMVGDAPKSDARSNRIARMPGANGKQIPGRAQHRGHLHLRTFYVIHAMDELKRGGER
jgi:hypothetical protein